MSTDFNVLFDDEAEDKIDAKAVATSLRAQLEAKNLPDKLMKLTRVAPTFGFSAATIHNLIKKGYTHTDGSSRTVNVTEVEGKGKRVSVREITEWVLNRRVNSRGGAGKGRALSSCVIRFNNPADLEVIRSFANVNGFTVLTATELAKMRKEKAAKKVEANSVQPA